MPMEIALVSKLTSQQAAFVQALILGGDKKSAAIIAGYAPEFANEIACGLVRQPQILAAVQIGVARDLSIGAVVANRVLQEFVADPSVDKRLRFACAKTILDRAGHIAPKAVAAGQAGELPLNEMSTTELRALADKLEGEISGRAKDVSSAKAAPRKPQVIEDIM